jgi:hypothetical protein
MSYLCKAKVSPGDPWNKDREAKIGLATDEQAGVTTG